jgi:hypothetical protein
VLGLVVLVAATKLLADKLGTSIDPARLSCFVLALAEVFFLQTSMIGSNSLFLNI